MVDATSVTVAESGSPATRPTTLQAAADTTPPPRRIAYLSYSDGLHDARTFRMARTAVEAGYAVTIYARWYPGLAAAEEHDGYRLIRAPWNWHLAIPGLRGRARRRLAGVMAADARAMAAGGSGDGVAPGPRRPVASASAARRPWTLLARPFERHLRLARMFPLHPLGWAVGLADVAEPADVWHGMWAGSLPALARLRALHGGRTIYDARDVYLQSRGFSTLPRPVRAVLARIERRWARTADRVITVNASYAALLETQLGVARPTVVMNVPERWDPPVPPPDRFRAALGLGPATRVVLYQGGLLTGRGIEQTMDAILHVPDAVLCLLGYGALHDDLATACARAPFAGRVVVMDAVPPAELIEWTASADVSVMAIQPTSINHRYTTPQKLFESIGAGVPVVASDLPGMAEIVRATDVGVLCDPTDPGAIAAAIRTVLDVPAAERQARRARILRVAHTRYAWEDERERLLEVYADLLTAPRVVDS